MGINRKELEEKTFQWFNSSISDKDYNSLSMSYLAHRNYRLYKYQSPLASLDTLSRFFEHLKTNTLSLSAPSVFLWQESDYVSPVPNFNCTATKIIKTVCFSLHNNYII